MKFFRSSWGLLRSIKPNRWIVYVTAAANLSAGLIPILTDIGAADLVAPVAGFNALAVMFLRGWQQWEKALYEAEQVQVAIAAQAEARAQGQVPGRSSLKLPR